MPGPTGYDDGMKVEGSTVAMRGGQSSKAVIIVLSFTAIVLLFLISFVLTYKLVVKMELSKSNEEAIVIPQGSGIAVEIPLGSNTAAIADILSKNGIIKNPTLFKLLSMYNGYDGTYKSGTHILSKELDFDQVMRVLSSNPEAIKVTIPEGFALNKIAETLASKQLIDKQKFLNAVQSVELDFKFLKDLPKRDNRLEGYLFPDTYEFDLKAGENEIIKSMVRNFDRKFKPEFYEQAKKIGLSVDQVVVLASIIEREAKLPTEKRTISGILYNRLKGRNNSPKKLESCATIQYVYFSRGANVTEEAKNRVAKGIITNEDKSIKDPYNTYLYEGLPPGPICSPGLDSIIAALDPEDTQYRYFVAKGDGSTHFSRTLEEHNAAMVKYGVKLTN